MNPISPDPTAPPADRRPILLAGAGGAGVLIGLLLLMTLAGSDAGPPPAAPPATAPAELEEPDAPAGLHPELAFSVARDPFEQLVTAPGPDATGPGTPKVPVPAEVPVAPAPPTPPPPASIGTPPPAGVGGTASAAPQPPAPPPASATAVPRDEEPPTPGYWHHPSPQQPPPGHAPAPQPPPQEPLPQQPPKQHPPQERSPGMIDGPVQVVRWLLEWLRLQWVVTDDAGSPRAVVTMGDQVYFPAEGEVFADHFFVESINPDCVEVSVTEFDMGICVPTPDQAGDATPNDPTATQACVVARPALPSEGADRPRLGLMPCERAVATGAVANESTGETFSVGAVAGQLTSNALVLVPTSLSSAPWLSVSASFAIEASER